MPLFHVHGLIAGLLTTLASGGTVIIHGKFAASKFWGHSEWNCMCVHVCVCVCVCVCVRVCVCGC